MRPDSAENRRFLNAIQIFLVQTTSIAHTMECGFRHGAKWVRRTHTLVLHWYHSRFFDTTLVN